MATKKEKDTHKEKTFVGLWIDNELNNALEREAEQQDRSKSSMIRIAIMKYLERRQP